MAKFASIAVEGIAIKEQAAQSAAHAQQQIVAPGSPCSGLLNTF